MEQENIVRERAKELNLKGFGIMYDGKFKLKKVEDFKTSTGTACNKNTQAGLIKDIAENNEGLTKKLEGATNSQKKCMIIMEYYKENGLIYEIPLISIL